MDDFVLTQPQLPEGSDVAEFLGDNKENALDPLTIIKKMNILNKKDIDYLAKNLKSS